MSVNRRDGMAPGGDQLYSMDESGYCIRSRPRQYDSIDRLQWMTELYFMDRQRPEWASDLSNSRMSFTFTAYYGGAVSNVCTSAGRY